MDFIHRPYYSLMKLCRDSDVLTPGRWRWCAPGARIIPYAHAFGSYKGRSTALPPLEGVGEVAYYGGMATDRTNPLYPGLNWCGSEDLWAHGGTESLRGTPAVDARGVPLCCQSADTLPQANLGVRFGLVGMIGVGGGGISSGGVPALPSIGGGGLGGGFSLSSDSLGLPRGGNMDSGSDGTGCVNDVMVPVGSTLPYSVFATIRDLGPATGLAGVIRLDREAPGFDEWVNVVPLGPFGAEIVLSNVVIIGQWNVTFFDAFAENEETLQTVLCPGVSRCFEPVVTWVLHYIVGWTLIEITVCIRDLAEGGGISSGGVPGIEYLGGGGLGGGGTDDAGLAGGGGLGGGGTDDAGLAGGGGLGGGELP